MSKIVRSLQKIFGGNLTPANNIGVFGSNKGGSPTYSNDPAVIQAAPWLNGWGGAVVGSNQPSIQDFNGFCYVISRQVAYILQQGVAEWDATTTYYTGSMVNVNGVLYVSLLDNNIGNSVTNPTWWRNYLSNITQPDARGVARAWCVFRSDGVTAGGQSCLVYTSWNVSSVVAQAVGRYRVNWSITAPVAYAVTAIGGGTYNSRDNIIGYADTVPPMTSSYVELQESVGGGSRNPGSECGYISVVAYW
jgi:hypothetical protein